MSTVSTTLPVSRPRISSPLAETFSTDAQKPRPISRPQPARKGSAFMTSRALRPFPSISTALQPSKANNMGSKTKTIKLIEPPKNHKMTFVLNLTQAELSRQE